MKAYQADIAKFEATDTQVFGMSVDSVPANREFAKQIEVTFPILSDFKRTVVKDYGVFNEEQGFGNRATFVIDKEGIIRHIDEGNVAIDPSSAAEAFNAPPGQSNRWFVEYEKQFHNQIIPCWRGRFGYAGISVGEG